jgi:hypothetical protein
VESDIRFYRRRACEEMAAASRAVTDAARLRRLQLVETYLDHLKVLKAPSPFTEYEMAQAHRPIAARAYCYKEEAAA